MRLRQTWFCGAEGCGTNASIRRRSSELPVKLIPVRIPLDRTSNKTREFQIGLVRYALSTNPEKFKSSLITVGVNLEPDPASESLLRKPVSLGSICLSSFVWELIDVDEITVFVSGWPYRGVV
jgi:hypothetical protein